MESQQRELFLLKTRAIERQQVRRETGVDGTQQRLRERLWLNDAAHTQEDRFLVLVSLLLQFQFLLRLCESRLRLFGDLLSL